MMKTLLFTMALVFLSNTDNFAQVIKKMDIFYWDNQTDKGKSTYRELKYIGESPYWSKPEKFDVILTFSKKNISANDEIEIIIEEQYEPTKLARNSTGTIVDKKWVPHKVIFSGNSNFIKSDKIIVKNCLYQTAYFLDSILYLKDGFRIVGIFHDKDSNKVETIAKTFYFDD